MHRYIVARVDPGTSRVPICFSTSHFRRGGRIARTNASDAMFSGEIYGHPHVRRYQRRLLHPYCGMALRQKLFQDADPDEWMKLKPTRVVPSRSTV